MNFQTNNPSYEPPKKKWFYRFDLAACLKPELTGGTEIHTREFTMPFEHPNWTGPFNSKPEAFDAGAKAFNQFVAARAHNRRDPRKFPI